MDILTLETPDKEFISHSNKTFDASSGIPGGNDIRARVGHCLLTAGTLFFFFFFFLFFRVHDERTRPRGTTSALSKQKQKPTIIRMHSSTSPSHQHRSLRHWTGFLSLEWTIVS